MSTKVLFRILSRINLLKTVWYNFRYLKLKEAIKFPIIIGKGVIIKKLGIIKFLCPIKPNLLSFGVFNIFIDNTRYPTQWINKGVVLIGGPIAVRTGAIICIDTCGVLHFEGHNRIGHLSTIFAHKSITIGEHSGLSWNCQLIDTDFHFMEDVSTHKIFPKTGSITVGRNCWIGNHVSINKGVSLADGCTVASFSVVTKSCNIHDTLLAGIPATTKRTGVRRIFDMATDRELEKEYWIKEFGQPKVFE